MEKDVEEGEEDEEEVTKYVHTFLDEEDEIHKSKKANVSRANHQASSVKTSSAKASSITVFMYIYSHCMGGGGGDYVHTYIFGGGPRGVEVSRSTAQSILRLHTYIIGGIIMQQAPRNILHSHCTRQTTNAATRPDRPLRMTVQPVVDGAEARD